MSSRITPLSARHWDAIESTPSIVASKIFVMTHGESFQVFNWVDEVVAWKRIKPIVGTRAKRMILYYLRNCGLPRAWLQGLAAMCMLFYEKLGDYSVLRLSLRTMAYLCAGQYTEDALTRIETQIVLLHYYAPETVGLQDPKED